MALSIITSYRVLLGEPLSARVLQARPQVPPHSIAGATSPQGLDPIRMGPAGPGSPQFSDVIMSSPLI
jgi:hypothetical protein